MSNERNSGKFVRKPSFLQLATEAGRAVTELGLSIPFRKFYRNYNIGDGHPVLVLPGFMASDRSTKPLRGFIDQLGYTAYGWDMGRNYAKLYFVENLADKVNEIHKTHGENVTLIGWSLGGVYAREIGKLIPDKVRQIITLGSPFGGITEPNNATWIYNLLPGNKRVVDIDPDFLASIPLPAPVPTTAIYTKGDGVVPWKVCLEKVETAIHQNIQVRGSHLGLGVNPSVLEIVADRLVYRKHNWEHFVAKSIMKDFLYYPSL